MLFELPLIPQIWHWAIAGAVVLMLTKAVLVAQIVRFTGIDALTAWRTGWLLAVGGEFGFALLAIALDAGAIASEAGQIVLTSVLFSMIVAPFLIRYNHALARWCAPGSQRPAQDAVPALNMETIDQLRDHVIICGYGRIGQSVAHFLEEEQIPFVALDLDPARVKEAHLAGERVFYGDSAERDMLEAVGVGRARLVVISHEDVVSACKVLHHCRVLRPDLPVMVRTRDETHVAELREAGASEIVPETLEASLMIAVHALLLLDVPISRVVQRMQERQEKRYHLLGELFRGDSMLAETRHEHEAERLRPVVLPPDSPVVGRSVGELELERVAITALVREGRRQVAPPRETRLEVGDVVLLFGLPDDLRRAERVLLG
jgi:monovalent cation:H+ antiporter-2, CPA2 family